MTNFQGVEIKPAVLQYINTDTLNSISTDIINANSTTSAIITGIERAFTVGFKVGWDLITLLTGTYIFNFLYVLLGPVSLLLAAPIVTIYVFLLGRAIMSYVRNG